MKSCIDSRRYVELLEGRRLLALAAYFEQVAISQAAISADPVLAGFESWDVKIRVYPGDGYTISDLIANLASGSFYNVPVAEAEPDGGNGNVAHPGLWDRQPNLEYDTWVATPFMRVEDTRIPGRGDDQPGPPVFSDTQISLTWGELANPHSGAGDYTIARLTASAGAAGALRGRIGHLKTVGFGSPHEYVPYSFAIGTAIPPPDSPPADPPPPASPPPPPPPPPPDDPLPPPAGSSPYGYLSGSVFADLDSDGRRDADEIGMMGRAVWIDANVNGKLDRGEKYTRVRMDGRFSMSRIPLGNHLLRVSVPAGFWRTSPGNGAYSISLGYHGQRADGRSFGMTNRAIIRAVAFDDWNFNGRIGSDEDRLFGIRIFLDTDGDGRYDPGERNALTNSSGAVAFRDLVPGIYRIGVVLPGAAHPTTPVMQRISFGTGKVVPTVNFGMH